MNANSGDSISNLCLGTMPCIAVPCIGTSADCFTRLFTAPRIMVLSFGARDPRLTINLIAHEIEGRSVESEK